MNLVREVRSISKVGKDIIFYAENRNYYPYLEGLVEKMDGRASYITSELTDPVLQHPDTFYINKLLPIFMATANCKVFVMTMPDLNSFHIRRSYRDVHYVYVFHSLVSTHMIYRQGAFDHYDSILCVGLHQIEEIRKRERMLGLKPKKLVEAGYCRLEKLYEAYKNYAKKESDITVLIAPTWGASNLLNWCGLELVELLLNKGYKVVLRLHPETVKRGISFGIIPRVNLTIETSIINMDSLIRADILITDWSGIGLKYAFGTERPVIYIDTPPKIRNSKYSELGIEPVESYLRSEIGFIIHLDNIENIDSTIQEILTGQEAWKDRLSKLRDKYVFNFGRSTEVGANYIKGLL